jgi:hypothetical protein
LVPFWCPVLVTVLVTAWCGMLFTRAIPPCDIRTPLYFASHKQTAAN